MAVGITENAPSAPPLEALNPATDLHHVNFIVTLDSNRYSEPIPAKKTSINDSESLRRIINEKINCDANGYHIINDVDELEFRQLIEFLENKNLPFKDQNHRLQMFAVAKQFNCPELQIHCIREVDANLNVSNVITVYRSLWFYGSLTSHKDPIDRKAKNNIKKNACTPDEYLTFLVFNVLQFISMNAETVLLSEEIDNLSFKEFENIVKQEDLLLHSEMVLINALTRWSREECRRKNIELTHENERTVLGELCYVPRYVLHIDFMQSLILKLNFPFLLFFLSLTQISHIETMRIRIGLQKCSIFGSKRNKFNSRSLRWQKVRFNRRTIEYA